MWFHLWFKNHFAELCIYSFSNQNISQFKVPPSKEEDGGFGWEYFHSRLAFKLYQQSNHRPCLKTARFRYLHSLL
jgi:hypothetical protein